MNQPEYEYFCYDEDCNSLNFIFQTAKNVTSPLTAVPPSDLSISIDPALSGFLTHGPNDDVPQGFHAVPYSMIPLLPTTQSMPSTSNAGLPSREPFTIETLATMLLSIEKQIILQETQRNITNQESRVPNVDTSAHALSMPKEQLTMEPRPRTWPDWMTPPQTCCKTIQQVAEATYEQEADINDKNM